MQERLDTQERQSRKLSYSLVFLLFLFLGCGCAFFGGILMILLSVLEIDTYIQNVTLVPLINLARVQRAEVLTFPLSYPEPEDEFCGYCTGDQSGEIGLLVAG